MFKRPPLRDPAYIKALRNEPCLFTGLRATENESVIAAHIGTAGKGLKSPDNETLPVGNSIHQKMHGFGEISVLREAPACVLRAAFRALAREMYAEWKQGRKAA